MALCATCKKVDFRTLLIACLQSCRERQETHGGDYDDPPPSDNSSKARHHDDIFAIEKSSGSCNLCKVIFQAFEKRGVIDAEEARGLPIIFRAFGNKIEVCFDTEEELIQLCGLDFSMNEADAREFFSGRKMKEDSSPAILKTIEKDPGSKASLATASGWLRDCLENHDSCKPTAEYQKPPKRLINVGNETQNPFLVKTSLGSRHLRWLSLSYCWGEEPSMKLTEKTMDKLRNGIPLNEFDTTVQDAILVTRALEITYIWIDALCIIQEDNGNDWIEQASKMNEIYGGSTVTLVVASSNSVKDGFLKDRELQYIPILWSSNTAGDPTGDKPQAKVFVSSEWDKSEDELNGPWSKRGWTMQEGLLPSRLLHYTSSQMIWKCGEEQRFERGVTKSLQAEVDEILKYSDDIAFGSGWLWRLDTFMKFKRFPDYIPSSLDYPLLLEPETFHLWYDFIEEYTQRRFKCISDRLLAISGLARIFGNTIRSRDYAAGLWKPDLIRGLMWHTKGAKLIPRQLADSMRAVNIAFPSWSWASVGYERVKNSQKNNNHFQALSRVEDVQIDLVDQHDPFGGVKSGSVTITGPLKKAPRLYNKEWNSSEASMSAFARHISETAEKESPEGVEHRYSSPPEGHFAALQMLEGIGSLDLLVLEATGEVSNGITVYHRVGVITLRYFPEDSAASPALIAKLEELDKSRAARLGPREGKGKGQKAANAVVTELRKEPWKTETVIIV
ncbi:HET-domain-containing protein [Mytilinidion resinicola]|uniref:HET-domain-containing protein n=1 Tax=Mytilinidion resinicola TaxID=574789 RepID=A0A6A6Y3A4_9PEZI|nr:HET-domain-containing protein [Mytilinidion resinicola]KAF2803262.1 HET-domain-containing protein [Mytilinidion resinicola]